MDQGTFDIIAEVSHILLVTIIVYVLMHIAYRLMGKRELGQLSTFDFVINLVTANIVASGVTGDFDYHLAMTVVFFLVLLQIVVAKVNVKWPRLRGLTDGEPSMVIRNGAIDHDEMHRVRINLDEMMTLLRQAGVASVQDIQYAIVESNGDVTVYDKNNGTDVYPLPLIISGRIKKHALHSLKKNEGWLINQLNQLHIGNYKAIDLLYYSEEQNKPHFIIQWRNEVERFELATFEKIKTVKEEDYMID